LRGDRFDLDELVSVAQNGYADERAGRVVIPETASYDLPGCDEILPSLRCDVDRRLHHVVEPSARSAESELEVRHDLLCLTRDVAGGHDVPCGVERASARGEDETRYSTCDSGIRIRDVVGEVLRADELDMRRSPHGQVEPSAPRIVSSALLSVGATPPPAASATDSATSSTNCR
jgi:hypothetical protein